MENREKILSKIKEIILSKEPNADIILYGSRARKDYTEESDWDILVLMDKDQITLQDEQNLRHSLYDIELDTGEIVSLMIYSQNEWKTRQRITPFYKNIEREGIRI